MAKSLLVIDDSSTIREAVQLALTGGEWDLVTATNGAEAMEALQQHRVDAILCDVALGDEDGYELCRSLGASAEGSGIPALLMGGNVNDTAALAVGASATLTKPFTSEQLQKTLQDTMEQSDFSFDFGDEPAKVADDGALELAPLEDDAPLGLASMADDFGLQPEEGTDESLEVEEIEVIDLSDDDEFDDLELLDDLRPVELPPIEPAAGDDSADTLEFETTGTVELPSAEPDVLDLDDMLAGATATPAPEEFEAVPMDLAPEPESRDEAGQEDAGAGWTVDGLVLGGDESRPPDPFPLQSEETPTETEPAPEEDEGVEPIGIHEPPVETDEAFEIEAEPEPAGDESQASEGWAAAEPAEVAEEPVATPSRAASYSDLEREWGLEETAAEEAVAEEEDTSAPLETTAVTDIALEDLLQPEVVEPATDAPEAAETHTLQDGEPDAAGGPPEHTGDEADQAAEEAIDEDTWDRALGLGTEPLATHTEEEVFPEDEALSAEPTTPEPEQDDLTADLDALAAVMAEPEDTGDLAASVAAGAGQAVREALAQSLSAEKLAPLVAAAVERVAWEVVPQLAERLIRETIARLQEEPPES